MRTAILSLITAIALLATAGDADAQYRRYRTQYTPGVTTYPSINTSPWQYGYNPGLYFPSYNYYPNYVYPASGFSFTTSGFGVSVGNPYVYPGYYGVYQSYYYSPRWRNW